MRRPEYAHTGFDPDTYEFEPVTYEQAAKVMAEAHYTGRLGATSVKLGMYHDWWYLDGVICFGTIPRNNAESICGPDYADSVLELTRLALYDWVPTNSESWLIGQAFRWLTVNRPDISILISYADPSAGHVGTIYQATNWIYTGMSTGDVHWQCEDGTTLHTRTVNKENVTKPPGQWQPSPGKHRYITFLGPPAQRRKLRRELRWQPLPYPKTASEVAA